MKKTYFCNRNIFANFSFNRKNFNNMTELSFEYLNKIASQIIMISSLLGGFSLTVMANLLVNKSDDKVLNMILKATIIAASSFLISVFAMTSIIMRTTEGYPFAVTSDALNFYRIVGVVLFMIGLISLSVLIALSGWVKSKKTGIFTTIVGIITFILIILNM